jgi:hypothetical protein
MQAPPRPEQILQAIYDVFRPSGLWPTVDAVDRIVDERWEADAYPLLESLPPALIAIDRLHLRPDGTVMLRVAAIAGCEGSREDLDLFLAAVRWLTDCERERRPDSPHVAELIQVRSEEFAAARFATEGVRVDPIASAKVHELLSVENLTSGGTSRIEGDPARWQLNVTRTIRPYRRVETLEDYLATRRRIEGEAAAQYAAAPGIPILEEAPGASAPGAADSEPYVFIAMPFGEQWSDALHEVIGETCKRLRAAGAVFVDQRADDIARPGRITDQILDAIERADIVIADIGGLNANVVYELGYAHASGATLVLLSQEPGASPFDLRDLRQIPYAPGDPEACGAELVAQLAAALGVKSPVPPGEDSRRSPGTGMSGPSADLRLEPAPPPSPTDPANPPDSGL